MCRRTAQWRWTCHFDYASYPNAYAITLLGSVGDTVQLKMAVEVTEANTCLMKIYRAINSAALELIGAGPVNRSLGLTTFPVDTAPQICGSALSPAYFTATQAPAVTFSAAPGLRVAAPLDIAGAELHRVRETHGNGSIFGGSYGWGSAGRFHQAQGQMQKPLAAAAQTMALTPWRAAKSRQRRTLQRSSLRRFLETIHSKPSPGSPGGGFREF